MDDLLAVAVALTIVLDPVAAPTAALVLAPERHARRVLVAIGVLVGGGLLAVAAVAAEPVLDLCNISPPSAQLAAGIVLLVPALDHLWPGGEARVRPRDASPARLGMYPFAVPVIAGPAGVLAALAYSASEGAGVTILALGIGLMVVAALAVAWKLPAEARAVRVLGPFVGAAMALVGFDLIRDGVFAS